MRDKKLRERIVKICFVVVLFNSFLISTSFISPSIERKNEIWGKPVSATNITVFSDDFECGMGQWETITGLWHLTDDSSEWPNPYHSYKSSMWFGNESTGNYYTGVRETGSLITKPIDLSGVERAYLEFFHWRTTENNPSWDISYIRVSTNNVTWTTPYQTGYNVNPWEHLILNISNYRGNASVRIKFDFDSIDGAMNNYRGWLVDDVQVLASFLNMTISHPADIVYPERSIGNSLSWTIVAPANATTHYTILRNDSEVMSGPWESGVAIDINIDGLLIGCYNYCINATDGLGNTTLDGVLVSVIPNMSHLAITHPPDKTYMINEYGKSISWKVSADNFSDGNYTVYRNGFNITNGTWIVPGTIVTISVDEFLVGRYNFTIALSDCWGVTIQDEVDITITPLTSHLRVNLPPDFSYFQNASGNFFLWVIYAEHAANGTFTVLLNGNQIDIGTWQAPGRSIKVDVDGLTAGQYSYTIVLEDCWGATVQGTVLVTVSSPSNLMLDQFILYMSMVGVGLACFIVAYVIKRYISKSRSASHFRNEHKYSKYGRII